MARLVYTGTRPDNGASDGNSAGHIVMYGVTFPKGVAVDVADPVAARKLAGNPYFCVAAEVVAAPQPVEPVVVALPAEAPEIGAALSQDGGTSEVVAEPTPTMQPRRKRAKK